MSACSISLTNQQDKMSALLLASSESEIKMNYMSHSVYIMVFYHVLLRIDTGDMM